VASSDSGMAADRGPVGVIDIGSNSVRLVVYEGLVRAPVALFNEKAQCGLGHAIEETGALAEADMAQALRTLGRFAVLTKAMQVGRLRAVATAAVRDARNGPAFVDAAAARHGIDVEVLSGADEGRLSALGVLAGNASAKGVVADLGGGSLELVEVAGGQTGRSTTLPIGPLRIGSGAKLGHDPRAVVDQAMAGVSWLAGRAGQTLHLVGGALRAIGRVHMARTDYPLRVLDAYKVPAESLLTLCELLAGLGRKSLRRIEGVPAERLPALPFAALTLMHLLRRLQPRHAVFCAHGLREGLIFEMLPQAARAEDPLLAACRREAAIGARFAVHAEELMAWLDPLFPEEESAHRRLRQAACLLSDIAWRVHPDYRAEHAFVEMLRAPLAGAEHADRAWLSLALHARYTGGAGGETVAAIVELLGRPDAVQARRVGLALRLAHTISGGAAGLLGEATLGLRDGLPRLALPGEAGLLRADVVMRRFESLVRAFDGKAQYG